MRKPPWGYFNKEAQELPDDVTSWGARAIVSAHGKPFMDIVHNRHGFAGEKHKELLEYINDGVIKRMQAKFAELHKAGKIQGHKAEEHLLYEDDTFKAVGSTNASCGYFYILAWFKVEAATCT